MAALTFDNTPAYALVSESFAAGLRADRRMGICEWAEREIRILKGPEPGRLRLSRTPYLRGMLEAFTEPATRDITYRTAAQVAKTTAIHVCCAYAADQDPGDGIYVMPSEDLAREISVERLQPMFQASPAVRSQFTGFADDQQAVRLTFLRMTLFFAWAKSPASLSSRPARYAFLDEVNKYPMFSGREADPIKLAIERTKLFWNRKALVASTPTTPRGPVSTRWAASDQRRYHVPCVQCGMKQILVSQFLKWPGGVDADTIDRDDLAWYECRYCGERMYDRDKDRMLSGGEWIAERPEARGHAGFHINTLYSPWVRWSAYAAEFLRSKDRPELLMNFTNSWEGEDWVEKALPVTLETVTSLQIPYTLGVVPAGGLLLTAGVDVQNEYVRYVVRAWGADDESWLIDYGTFLRTKADNGLWNDDDIEQIATELLPTHYEHANGGRASISLVYMDSGYRTATVYAFAQRYRHMVTAVKGANEVQIDGEDMGRLMPRTEKAVPKMPGFFYTRINTTYYKDMLQGMREHARKCWHIPDGVDAVYLSEVSAEHKRIVRDAKGQAKHVWTLREGCAQNHYWDCEVYALAAADKRNFRRLSAKAAVVAKPRAKVMMPDGRPFFVGNR